MKKILLLIITHCISLHINAQYVDSLWQVEHNTTSVLYAENLEQKITQNESTVYYTFSKINSVLGVEFTNYMNQASFIFTSIQFEGASPNFFTKDLLGNNQDHKTFTGTTVDFSDSLNRIVSLEIQTEKTLAFRCELYDIQGKVSDIEAPYFLVLPSNTGIDLNDESKWQKITVAWNEHIPTNAHLNAKAMIDSYTPEWWYRSNSNLRDFNVPLDSTKIVGFGLVADPGGSNDIYEVTKFYVRNVTVGKSAFLDIPTVELSNIKTSQNIDILDFYEPTTSTVTYSTTMKHGNHIVITQNAANIHIRPKQLCTEFIDTLSIQITDGTKIYKQDIAVTMKKEAVPSPELGIATIDSIGKNVLIAWNRENVDYIASYNIYREGLSNIYSLLKNVPYDEWGQIVDQTALINKRAYKYVLTAIDSCGNESEYSTPHKSIHLQKVYTNNELLLSWTLYEGAEVLGYKLTEGYSYNTMTQIDEFGADQTSYTIQNPGKKLYRIETIMPSIIDPKKLKAESGPYSLAMSNIAEAETYITSIPNNKIDLKIINNTVSYSLECNPAVNYTVKISNNLGQILYSKTYSHNNQLFDTIQLQNGIYSIAICSESGNYTEQFVVTD